MGEVLNRSLKVRCFKNGDNREKSRKIYKIVFTHFFLNFSSLCFFLNCGFLPGVFTAVCLDKMAFKSWQENGNYSLFGSKRDL